MHTVIRAAVAMRILIDERKRERNGTDTLMKLANQSDLLASYNRLIVIIDFPRHSSRQSFTLSPNLFMPGVPLSINRHTHTQWIQWTPPRPAIRVNGKASQPASQTDKCTTCTQCDDHGEPTSPHTYTHTYIHTYMHCVWTTAERF